MSKSLIAVVVLALVALPMAAQQKSAHSKTRPAAPAASHRQKKQPARHAAQLRTGELKSGEAARLATKEAGLSREEHEVRVDNRGRVSSSHHAKKRPTKQAAKAPQAKAAPKSQSKHASQPVHPKKQSAELKAGNFKTSNAGQAQMKEASAAGSQGWSAQTESNSPPAPDTPKARPQPRLKKHNARMF